MRVAVVADLHANIRAIEAVGKALASEGVDRVICAGDIVGYNAEPVATVAWVREHVDVAVLGNHDVGVTRGEQVIGTSSAARAVQDWTREQLSEADRDFLDGLPAVVEDDSGLICAHGCYLNDIYYIGYVTTTMLRANLDALVARPGGPHVAICGHTHLPMVSWLYGGSAVRETAPGRHRWPGGADAVLINPGSVGQPRTGDPRACFAIIDTVERTAELRRCEYDVTAAAAAIVGAGLPDDLARRLEEGR